MKENKKKKKQNWLSRHMPTRRRFIQLYAALLFNSYLKGYITGDIFKGITKTVCTPGLLCYSCPGAVTACPIGSLQNAFASSNKSTAFYVIGILLLYGVLFGRWICGWLCPFGLVQDLFHKIKTPKLKKSFVTRALSFVKYVVLAVFVVIIPLLYVLRDFPLPAFCKYICPAGTFGGAIGLLINPANAENFSMLGPLFTWKFALMVSLLVGAVFIYRIFCRFLCPLGAFYGLFNRFCLFGIKLEKDKCINCGICISTCKMDINTVGDAECIQCGECVSVCPAKAITWKGAKIILPDNEIESAKTINEKNKIKQKRDKRVKTLRIITTSILALILASSLVYCNFFAESGEGDENTTPEIQEPNTGYEVGEKCPTYSLELVDGNGEKVNVKDFAGKSVVINFWGTWCGPCKAELPHFDELANEYADEVVFLVIHTVSQKEKAPEYIETNFPDSKMVFAYDLPLNAYSDMYFTLLGGTNYYPRTLVLDKNGIVTFNYDGGLSYNQLKAQIENALAK